MRCTARSAEAARAGLFYRPGSVTRECSCLSNEARSVKPELFSLDDEAASVTRESFSLEDEAPSVTR